MRWVGLAAGHLIPDGAVRYPNQGAVQTPTVARWLRDGREDDAHPARAWGAGERFDAFAPWGEGEHAAARGAGGLWQVLVDEPGPATAKGYYLYWHNAREALDQPAQHTIVVVGHDRGGDLGIAAAPTWWDVGNDGCRKKMSAHRDWGKRWPDWAKVQHHIGGSPIFGYAVAVFERLKRPPYPEPPPLLLSKIYLRDRRAFACWHGVEEWCVNHPVHGWDFVSHSEILCRRDAATREVVVHRMDRHATTMSETTVQRRPFKFTNSTSAAQQQTLSQTVTVTVIKSWERTEGWRQSISKGGSESHQVSITDSAAKSIKAGAGTDASGPAGIGFSIAVESVFTHSTSVLDASQRSWQEVREVHGGARVAANVSETVNETFSSVIVVPPMTEVTGEMVVTQADVRVPYAATEILRDRNGCELPGEHGRRDFEGVLNCVVPTRSVTVRECKLGGAVPYMAG